MGSRVPSRFAGTWRAASSPDFDREYLEIEGRPFVMIGKGRRQALGEFHIGLLSGEIDAWFEGEVLRFTFDGTDEGDPICGAGTARREGDRLLLVLKLHGGDAYTFVCRRARS